MESLPFSSRSKWGLILTLGLIILLTIMTVLFELKNKLFTFIAIGIFAIIPILFLIFIIKSFRRHKTIFLGLIMEGVPALIVTFVYLIFDIGFFALVVFFILLNLGIVP